MSGSGQVFEIGGAPPLSSRSVDMIEREVKLSAGKGSELPDLSGVDSVVATSRREAASLDGKCRQLSRRSGLDAEVARVRQRRVVLKAWRRLENKVRSLSESPRTRTYTSSGSSPSDVVAAGALAALEHAAVQRTRSHWPKVWTHVATGAQVG